jgi:hypothetical protein
MAKQKCWLILALSLLSSLIITVVFNTTTTLAAQASTQNFPIYIYKINPNLATRAYSIELRKNLDLKTNLITDSSNMSSELQFVYQDMYIDRVEMTPDNGYIFLRRSDTIGNLSMNLTKYDSTGKQKWDVSFPYWGCFTQTAEGRCFFIGGEGETSIYEIDNQGNKNLVKQFKYDGGINFSHGLNGYLFEKLVPGLQWVELVKMDKDFNELYSIVITNEEAHSDIYTNETQVGPDQLRFYCFLQEFFTESCK